ncbi:DNA-3-methyladenine glycosylase I, partial [Campylobacter concisus]|uniref:DNA-3-methyladenine glycosylase I n=1 Tax=Campylobacter concisus TaxID=199 RepID=UPI0015D8CE42
MRRCDWSKGALDIASHDNEWGKLFKDDSNFFDMLVLEGSQAGLSWPAVLQ